VAQFENNSVYQQVGELFGGLDPSVGSVFDREQIFQLENVFTVVIVACLLGFVLYVRAKRSYFTAPPPRQA
jgi:hypothetical protein